MAKDNQVTHSVSKEQITAVLAALEGVEQTLKPILKSLTNEERKTIPKMSDKTIPFVEKSLEYAHERPEFMPFYVDKASFEKDVKTVEDLMAVVRKVELLSQYLNDTVMQAGSDAYKAALNYYNTVKQATRSNVPAAQVIYDDLSKRFESQKQKKS